MRIPRALGVVFRLAAAANRGAGVELFGAVWEAAYWERFLGRVGTFPDRVPVTGGRGDYYWADWTDAGGVD